MRRRVAEDLDSSRDGEAEAVLVTNDNAHEALRFPELGELSGTVEARSCKAGDWWQALAGITRWRMAPVEFDNHAHRWLVFAIGDRRRPRVSSVVYP